MQDADLGVFNIHRRKFGETLDGARPTGRLGNPTTTLVVLSIHLTVKREPIRS